MNFLKEMGFKEELITKLRDKYEESVLEIFEEEKDKVIDVIRYLEDIGINYIDDILLYRIELFTLDVEAIKTSFESKNIYELVDLINEDPITIDSL